MGQNDNSTTAPALTMNAHRRKKALKSDDPATLRAYPTFHTTCSKQTPVDTLSPKVDNALPTLVKLQQRRRRLPTTFSLCRNDAAANLTGQSTTSEAAVTNPT